MIATHNNENSISALRPMTLAEILDRTFKIYQRKFALLFAVASIPATLMLAVHLADELWVNSASLTFHSSVTQFGRIVISMLVSLGFYHISCVVDLPFNAALVKQASCWVLDEPCSLLDSLRFFRRRWIGYLWITILKVTAVLVLPEVIVSGVFIGLGFSMDAAGLLNDNASGAFIFLGLLPALLGIGLFLWMGACFSLAIPAAALEDLRGKRAMKRSWVLTRESRWRIVTLWVLMLIFMTVLAWGLEFLLRWGLYVLNWQLHLHRSRLFFEAVVHVFRAAIHAGLLPLYPLSVTLFYYDQRIRHEGFDIEIMMHRAGMNATAAAALPQAPEAARMPQPEPSAAPVMNTSEPRVEGPFT